MIVVGLGFNPWANFEIKTCPKPCDGYIWKPLLIIKINEDV